MRAFTLIESLIYIALFGIVMSGAISGFYAISESVARNQTRALLETEGNFIMNKISFDSTHTQSATISQPSYNSSSTSLSLLSDSGNSIQWQLNGTFLVRSEDSTTLPISNNFIQVDSILFTPQYESSTSSRTNSIETELVISATSSNGSLLSSRFFDIFTIFP